MTIMTFGVREKEKERERGPAEHDFNLILGPFSVKVTEPK